MADQPLLLSPDHTGLDRAGWARLSKIADATQSALTEEPKESKKPNQAGVLLAEIVAALERDWHRLWHPLESIREWWSNQAQANEQYREQGSERGPKGPTPTPPKGPTLDDTWVQVRDQMFEAAKDLKADPKEVASQIVSAIPTEHRAAIAERLSNLAEIARVAAGMSHPPKIESAPIKEAREFGEPPPERVAEPPIPDNVRTFPTRPERQVPPQPLPEAPVVARAPTQAPSQQTKAKSR